MANIALLNRCNLRCPYCFADSYTAEEKEDITLDRFRHLLNLCAEDGQVGIIGGEPFLHKDIGTMLEMLRYDGRFGAVMIFTNGIYADRAANHLGDYKFRLLLNINSRRDMGEASFERMRENLRALLPLMGIHRITPGINVYREDQDFSDFLSLVREFGFRRIRVSLVIPHDRREGGIPYFKRMNPTLLSLYRSLRDMGVCPCYDCNAVPACVYTEEERAFLATLPYESEQERQIFMGERSVCSPVIDLYPDGSATRCFGMYDACRVKAEDFESLTDLRNHFFKEVDCRLVNNPSCEDCESCYKYKVFGCFGGCLCYKE